VALGLRIQPACRLVEQQHGKARRDGARERDPLTLTSGDGSPARPQARGSQRIGEVLGTERLERPASIDAMGPERDIRGQRIRQEGRLLRHPGERSSGRPGWRTAQRDAVEENLSPGGRVEAQQRAQQGRLAGARRAFDRDDCTRFDA